MLKKIIVTLCIIISIVTFQEKIYELTNIVYNIADDAIRGIFLGEEDIIEIENNILTEDNLTIEANETQNIIDESILAEIEGYEEGYYYSLLDTQEQSLYEKLLISYLSYQYEVDLSQDYSTMDSDVVHTVHWYVLLDHPEIFWINDESSVSYVDTDDGKILKTINATDNYNVEEIEYYISELSKVELAVEEYISGVDNEYEKAILIYEYIILNCTYDSESAAIKISDGESTNQTTESGTIIGSLINGTAVCSGYAKAFAYLLSNQEITSFSVVGYADGVGHEWNMIQLGGYFYHVDCTWGDPTVENVEAEYILYDYFGLTTDIIELTHIEMDGIEYPICTATEYNYYNYNGWCFDSYDYEELKLVFEEAINEKKETISFSYVDEVTYQTALTSLINEDLSKVVTTYSDKVESKCSYMTIEELYVISIEFEYK